MKFQRSRAYARSFGELLAEAVGYVKPEVIVTHLPTASSRIRQRGFDQAALIAMSFAKQLHLRYQPLLTRHTQSDQIGKNRLERQKQMQQSFGYNSRFNVAGQTVLLLDDVITTGASIEAAATVLRTHGAAHVDAAVVARHYLK
jgi:ComF family protein